MRIITGKYKGRHFDVPRSFKARPTTDFAKENIFNVLNGLLDFEGATALDLFSGTDASRSSAWSSTATMRNLSAVAPKNYRPLTTSSYEAMPSDSSSRHVGSSTSSLQIRPINFPSCPPFPT